MPERIFQYALLGCCLRSGIKVLHTAAATDTEMRATRRHAQAGWFKDGFDTGDFEVGFASETAVSYALSRKRSLNEDGLAIEVRNSPAFMVQRFNRDFVHVQMPSCKVARL
jgi:hypothetical protein